jgi:eukaryotic-like serine/threonine-protein kinase
VVSPLTACPQCALEFSGGEVFCPVDGARLLALSSASGVGSGFGVDPLLGQTLAGRYRILRKIGEGGMGIVYEAIHVVIEKRVALKILREDFSHRDDVVERFRQEAKSASRIGHEHIIDISDFGVTPSGAHFFVMELLHGRDLAEELEQKGPLPTRRAIGIALQCAKALGAAHAKGIVHRDMKPENIFLMERDTGEDFVKIVDFGIAKMSELETANTPGRKLTKTGMIFGTPEYMSPEHAAGKALDHRVDVYAMGIILYELLTGRVPFVGDTFMGILTQHMFEQVPPLRVAYPSCSAPPELEQLIFRAVSKSADDRQQSMDELAHELTAVLQFQSPTSSSLPPPGTITHVDRPRPTGFGSQPPRFGSSFGGSGGQAATEFGEYGGFDLDEPPRRTKATPWLWISLLGILAAGVAGALLILRPSPSPAAPLQVAPRVPQVPMPVAHEPAPLPVAPAPPARELPPAEVSLEVLSEPNGAAVLVDGKSACDPTPCRIVVTRGAPLKLTVQKSGYRNGSTELTPDRDFNQVQLTLVKRREGARSGNRMEGDLMLPDAFGKR